MSHNSVVRPDCEYIHHCVKLAPWRPTTRELCFVLYLISHLVCKSWALGSHYCDCILVHVLYCLCLLCMDGPTVSILMY